MTKTLTGDIITTKEHHEYKHVFYGNENLGSTLYIADTQLDSCSYPTGPSAEQGLLELVCDPTQPSCEHHLDTYTQTIHFVNGKFLEVYPIDIHAILNEYNEQAEEEKRNPDYMGNVVSINTNSGGHHAGY